MAKFDYGGGCPCGLYRDCIEQCENYVAPGEVLTKYVLEAQKRALEKKKMAAKLEVRELSEEELVSMEKQAAHQWSVGSWAEASAREGKLVGEGAGEVYAAVARGIVGKCGCGAFPQCLPGCAQYGRDEEKEAEKEYNRARLEAMKDMLGAAQPAKAKTNVVWVVGRDWEPTSKLMFFWREEDAKRAVKLLGRVGDDEGRKISLSVWSVEVEG
jgi:hypothetical protein